MERHSQKLVKPFTRHSHIFTMRQVYQQLGLEASYCTKWVEPLDVIAIGENNNKHFDKRNAVIIIFDPKFERQSTLSGSCGSTVPRQESVQF